MQHYINIDRASRCHVGIGAVVDDQYDQIPLTDEQAYNLLSGQLRLDDLMVKMGTQHYIPEGPIDVITLPMVESGDLTITQTTWVLNRVAGLPTQIAIDDFNMLIRLRDNPHIIDPIWFTRDNGYVAQIPSYFNYDEYVLVANNLISSITLRTE